MTTTEKTWTLGQDISTLEQLEELPIGSKILDGGMLATKHSSGAWEYQPGEFWEPHFFPCMVVSIPE